MSIQGPGWAPRAEPARRTYKVILRGYGPRDLYVHQSHPTWPLVSRSTDCNNNTEHRCHTIPGLHPQSKSKTWQEYTQFAGVRGYLCTHLHGGCSYVGRSVPPNVQHAGTDCHEVQCVDESLQLNQHADVTHHREPKREHCLNHTHMESPIIAHHPQLSLTITNYRSPSLC